ncbi:MAG: MerR family transcriptional regulator, partial [Prevotella sp.]|nr:MerR family transcriptional regulator [Prevotella sp.]
MALNTEKNLKLFYSIKEVAEIIGVNESLLRYWEKEFPQLKPKTGANRVRQYTEKDIEQIKVIYNLVKVRGFKISAAKKMIHANRQGVDK